MILGLVFSRDRALQLDGLLVSLRRHVAEPALLEVVVLYKASTPQYQSQYDELARTYGPSIRFLGETDFQQQLIAVLDMAHASGEEAQSRERRKLPFRQKAEKSDSASKGVAFVLFLVDDTLLVRSLSLAGAQAGLMANPDALGFSLRLGRNTTHNYVLNRQQEPPTFESAGSGMLKYNWTKADGDFGYPLEISSSLYRLPIIAGITAKLRFTDPNTLEGELALQARRFSRSNPTMLCLENSAAFSAPINRVQDVYENRSGANPEWSIERLASKFDAGLRIDVSALDGFVPSACHQEVELSFEPRAAQPTGE